MGTGYVEAARELPLYKEVDVLVVGAGVSGVGAAVAAARQGVSAMMVDCANAIGGMSTTGLMSHFAGYVRSALYDEVLRRMAEKQDMCIRNSKAQRVTIDPEILKLSYLEMAEESGAETLLYTRACLPVLENGKISGVIIENKNGRQVVRAKVVIDATGDGDIAYSVGVPYRKGRDCDQSMQPATLMFKLGGVDTERAVYPGSFETLVPTKKGELQALAKKLLPFPAGHVLLYATTLPGIVTVNMTNAIGIDGTDAASMTQAEFICRGQISKIVSFLREYAPGYENCFVISTGSMMGIRETRHFEGEYCLTEDDILNCRQFDDWIVRDACFNFDVHNLTGPSLDVTGMQKTFPENRFYQIPYRCCLPKETDNLLLTGRLISGTHMAHSNYRAMPICLALGEGTGTAAAVAVMDRLSPREIDVAKVQQILLRDPGSSNAK
ncbi:MAG: FAD-dependent oxidoreductase [Clostridia bacterium]|nr:FAD-dependent oxidoreductase [Clostridia bacterium]